MESNRHGSHCVRFIAPNIVYVAWDGDVNREQARAVTEFCSLRIEGIDAVLVTDLRRLGAIPPDARKEFATQRVPQRTDRDYRLDLVFIGANLRTRVLMTVVVAAVSFTSNVKVHTHYLATVPEAAAWAGVDPAAFAP